MGAANFTVLSALTFLTVLVRQVKNSSRIPAIFTIDPPKASSGVLKITPLAGLLLGNQATSVELAFAPRGTKEYRFKLPVKVMLTS